MGKAVRDGVIDARVDHAKGWMESWRAKGEGHGGRGDVYETGEPREAFAKRIGFCLDLHNESVKVRFDVSSLVIRVLHDGPSRRV